MVIYDLIYMHVVYYEDGCKIGLLLRNGKCCGCDSADNRVLDRFFWNLNASGFVFIVVYDGVLTFSHEP